MTRETAALYLRNEVAMSGLPNNIHVVSARRKHFLPYFGKAEIPFSLAENYLTHKLSKI